MSNFIIDCLNGDAFLADVNEYIDRWHMGNSELPLYEYLGMNKKEYMLFVQDENYLGKIVAAHKFNKTIESIVKEEVSMAARSDNSATSDRLQKWLESEGLWE